MITTRKRGRPRKEPDERKGNALQVRLSEEERDLCDEAANMEGVKLSKWARETLVRAAKRRLQRE